MLDDVRESLLFALRRSHRFSVCFRFTLTCNRQKGNERARLHFLAIEELREVNDLDTTDYARQRKVSARQRPYARCCFFAGSFGALQRLAARLHRIVLPHLHTFLCMKLPSVIFTLLAAFLVFVASSVEAKDPPAFPGQPHLNGALKHLNAAKEKVSTDATGALNELEAAHNALAHAIHNKGTYQNMARELTDQATEHLQKGEVEKAAHKIDEAIATVNRGGQTGDH